MGSGHCGCSMRLLLSRSLSSASWTGLGCSAATSSIERSSPSLRWRPGCSASVLRGSVPTPIFRLASGIALAGLALASILKASNEPAVSNKWTFYTSAEIAGLRWADTHQRSTATWIGPDERLAAAYLTESGSLGTPIGGPRASLILRSGRSSSPISFVCRRRGSGWTLPAIIHEDRVYDNGTVQVYRVRP